MAQLGKFGLAVAVAAVMSQAAWAGPALGSLSVGTTTLFGPVSVGAGAVSDTVTFGLAAPEMVNLTLSSEGGRYPSFNPAAAPAGVAGWIGNLIVLLDGVSLGSPTYQQTGTFSYTDGVTTYNDGETWLEQITLSPTLEAGTPHTLSITGAGDGSNGAFYSGSITVNDVPGRIPEPASLALVVLALGAAGASARRRVRGA